MNFIKSSCVLLNIQILYLKFLNIKQVPDLPRKMGPDSVLTKTEETTLKDWCIASAKCGFPLKRDDFLNTVHNIISEDKGTNPFVNNRPRKK